MHLSRSSTSSYRTNLPLTLKKKFLSLKVRSFSFLFRHRGPQCLTTKKSKICFKERKLLPPTLLPSLELKTKTEATSSDLEYRPPSEEALMRPCLLFISYLLRLSENLTRCQLESHKLRQARWHNPVITVLVRWRQDLKFKVSL